MRRFPIEAYMKDMLDFNSTQKIRLVVAFFVSLIFVAMVLGIIFLIFALRRHLIHSYNQHFWAPMIEPGTAFLNALQIITFNEVYENVAQLLTNFENHRTQSSYDTSLISKS